MLLLLPHVKSHRLVELRLCPLRVRRKGGREQDRGLEARESGEEDGGDREGEDARLSLLPRLLLLLKVESLLLVAVVAVVILCM
jgi:hypothetical protein